MSRLPLVALAILLSGCSSATGSTGKHSTASPSGSSAPVSAASSTPSGSSGPSPCRLPVVVWTQGPQGQVPSAGFLSYPDGQLSPDPSGSFVQEGTRYRSAAQPSLYGGGPAPGSYDWPLKRWLPAKPRSVSPDGTHYAYESDFGAIHVVDVATGGDRTFKGPSGPDTVLYYAKEGVYFNHAWEGPPGPGLWLLDPATGSIQTVFSDKAVDTVGGFAAWLPDVNPADAHPVFSQFSGTNMPNQILRRDLNRGATLPWFYQPGRSIAVIGFDPDRHPLIVAESLGTPDISQVWQVPAAKQGHQVYAGTQAPQTVSDGRGIWFSDQQGISVYTSKGELHRVSPTVADLAGACR